MNFKLNGRFWGICSGLLGLTALLSPAASANDSQIPPYEDSLKEEILAQVTSITQLRDVSPQNWAFEAIRNLVENYGCIEGYPDRTYRGNRSLSRNEFAAGLNSCLEALEARLRDEVAVINTNSQTSETIGISTQDMFNRAFYNYTGRFYDIINLSGQANLIFGWRRWENSFFDRMIADDAELFGAVYEDALEQQMDHTLIRTRDLPNPYQTSVFQNPSYIRPLNPTSTREIRF